MTHIIEGRNVPTPIPVRMRAKINTKKLDDITEISEPRQTHTMPPRYIRLSPIAGPITLNTGIRTENVKVYSVMDHTAEVRGTVKASFKVGMAMDTMLFPKVPINVPTKRIASKTHGAVVFDEEDMIIFLSLPRVPYEYRHGQDRAADCVDGVPLRLSICALR